MKVKATVVIQHPQINELELSEQPFEGSWDRQNYCTFTLGLEINNTLNTALKPR